MELFSWRRWTTGLSQQSNNYGIMACMCCINFWIKINTTGFWLEWSSLHILLLKSSMLDQSKALKTMTTNKVRTTTWVEDQSSTMRPKNIANFREIRSHDLMTSNPSFNHLRGQSLSTFYSVLCWMAVVSATSHTHTNGSDHRSQCDRINSIKKVAQIFLKLPKIVT